VVMSNPRSTCPYRSSMVVGRVPRLAAGHVHGSAILSLDHEPSPITLRMFGRRDHPCGLRCTNTRCAERDSVPDRSRQKNGPRTPDGRSGFQTEHVDGFPRHCLPREMRSSAHVLHVRNDELHIRFRASPRGARSKGFSGPGSVRGRAANLPSARTILHGPSPHRMSR
jgi:hypothetical protein